MLARSPGLEMSPGNPRMQATNRLVLVFYMAIINCPRCSRRMSDRSPACPHCDLALAELGPEDVSRMELRRWRRKVWRAKNMAYTAMALLIVGAVWWWLVEPAGWTIPPPPLPVGLIMLSGIGYVIARGWLLWLNMKRNRPGAARQKG